MADIAKSLQVIKNAVYGQDMRGAIHDSIKAVNDDVKFRQKAIVGNAQGTNITVSDAYPDLPFDITVYGKNRESIGTVMKYTKAFNAGGKMIEKNIPVKANRTYKVKFESAGTTEAKELCILTCPVTFPYEDSNHNNMYVFCVTNNGGRQFTVITSQEFEFTTTGTEKYINITTGNTANDDGSKIWTEISVRPAEKSINQPSSVIGIGECGDFSISVTDGEETKTEAIALSAPLYELKKLDGSLYRRDSVDTAYGVIDRQIGVMQFDGTEEWYENGKDTEKKLIKYFVGGELFDGRMDAINGPRQHICSHFTYGDDDANWFVLDNSVFYTFASNRSAWFGVCVSSEIYPTVESFKTWVAGQNGVGTPLTLWYPIAPVEEDIESTIFSSKQPMTAYNNEDAEMLIKYSRDLNLFLENERETFNPMYANAILGSAEGNNITIDDAVEGTPLSLTLYGKCTETLTDPDAEKSPDNPAEITGIGESGSVTVTQIKGKNLFDADTLYDRFCAQAVKNGYDPTYVASDNVSFDGRTCVRCSQIGVAYQTPFFENGKPNVQYTFTMWVYTDSDTGGIMVNAEYTDGTTTYTQITKHKEWEQHTLTTTAGKTVKRIYLSYTSAASTLFDKNGMMLNEGAQPLVYEAYDGEDIVVPLDNPLYKLDARPGFETLPNWSAKLDEITGAKLIRRMVREEFDGTEDWYVNGEVKNGLIRYFLTGIYGLKIGGVKPISCTHFNYDAVNGPSFYVENACAYYVFDTNTGRGWFGACVSVDRFPTVDDFKVWLAEQAAAGTPVGFVRPIEPVETNLTDTPAGQALLALEAKNGTTYLNSEGADMEVRYNRDVNKAIEELQNAVAALNAAAIENI